MIIQISDLNDEKFGRFGNQLFKFFFLKILEKEIDCEIRYPGWLGNLVFNLENSASILSNCELLIIDPSRNLSLKDTLRIVRGKIADGLTAIDLKGFFQFHTSEYENYKELFHETFKINPLLLEQIDSALLRINPNNDEIMSIHIRRGDYTNYQNNPLFWTISTDAIFKSLENLESSSFRNPKIYICSDDLAYCKHMFEEKNIAFFCADDLFAGENDTNKLVIDFILMTKSNVSIISNSSLSFFASMQNKNGSIF